MTARDASNLAAHELCVLRLRADGWLGRRRADGKPRVAATACWRFPIYSQTFVQREAKEVAGAGFALRFLYSGLAPKRELAEGCEGLWRLKRRVWLQAAAGARDLARYRQRMPDTVDRLLAAVSAASGQSVAELVRHEHVLHAFSYTRAVEAWGADYLHSYFFYERTLFSLVASFLLGIPRGVSCYADHLLDDYPLKVVRLHLSTCDVVVATSERIRDELETIHGAPLPTVVVKPNAIDTTRFRRAPAPPPAEGEPWRLVTVCRIDPKKGLGHLVEAVHLLRERGRNVQLHVVGDVDPVVRGSVECLADLRAQVASRSLGGVVRFEGRCTGGEVRSHLERAHAFVAPFVELPNGDKDGIPTALLEAMAAGVPVVTTDAGSITEVIEPERQALVVPQHDASRLAGAIERLLADPALASRLAAEAVARAESRFDVGANEAALHARIRGAIASRRAAPAARQWT